MIDLSLNETGDITSVDIFQGLESRCMEVISYSNPVCLHPSNAPCFVINILESWKPWEHLNGERAGNFPFINEHPPKGVRKLSLSTTLKIKDPLYILFLFY